MPGKRRRPATAAPARCWLVALALLGAAPRASAQTSPGEARAPPTSDALNQARALFAEALRDENARRYDAALEKFRRVSRVKDTPPVEYRIGSCYEGLGQWAHAYEAYRAAVELGQRDAGSTEVVKAAQARMDALGTRVARLTVTLPAGAPADAKVRIDDTPVEREALQEPLVLEPGNHVVTATASDAAPFRTEIALPEGGQGSLSVTLTPRPPPPPATTPPATSTSMSTAQGNGTAKTLDDGSSRRTMGWVAIAGGGALIAGSVVTLLLRHGAISSLNESCPGGRCPPGSNQSDLESTRSRALAEGPIAVILGIAGVAAAGVGAYLLVTAPAANAPATGHAMLVPVIRSDGGEAALVGRF